jgi:Xaa-Pro dipeptidase
LKVYRERYEMVISLKERARRFTAIRAMMKEDEIDSLLVVGREGYMNRGNIRYISNFGAITMEQLCIFGPEGDPVYITGNGPALARLQNGEWPLDMRVTTDPAGQVIEEITNFDKGNKVGLVGMQDISVPNYLRLKEKFGDRLVDAGGIFQKLRSIKSAEEIEMMKVSASIADTVYNIVIDKIRPGLSGYEIYSQMKKTIIEMGCEYSFELISTDRANINLFHPTGEKLEKDGLLTAEISPAYQGYFAQLPVTLPVGEYPPHVKKMLPVWKQANKAMLEILRPGTVVSELCRVINEAVEAGGYRAPWRPGHAIGLDLIDFWSVSDSNNIVLEPGMTMAIHPNVLMEPVTDGNGIGMGYTYLVTDTGYERLSKVEIID